MNEKLIADASITGGNHEGLAVHDKTYVTDKGFVENDVNRSAVKHPARAAEEASQAWKPWRSYAVIRAWASMN